MVSALGPQSVLLKMSKVKALEAGAFEEFVARHRVMAAAITFVPDTVGVLNHHFEVVVLNAWGALLHRRLVLANCSRRKSCELIPLLRPVMFWNQ